MAAMTSNLRPFTSETARAAGAKGKATQKQNRQMRAIAREIAKEAAPESIKQIMRAYGVDTDGMTYKTALIYSMYFQGIKGNAKVLDKLLGMIGEDTDTKIKLKELAIKELELKQLQESAQGKNERVMIVDDIPTESGQTD